MVVRRRASIEQLERRLFLSATAAAVSSTPDYPGAIWDPAAPGNYGTGASNPRWIVIHTTEEPASDAITEFTTAGTEVSVNYMVTLTGVVYQFVHNANIAYDVGNYAYNVDSIGIEHERYGNNNATEAEYEASAKLVRFLAAEYNIPLVHLAAAVAPADPADGSDIIGHYQVPDPNNPTLGGGADHHTDPINWNWPHYMSLVNGYTAPDVPTNTTPAANATDVSLTSTLKSSSFVDLDSGSTQTASEWVITNASTNAVVYDSGTDTTDLTSLTVPSGTLSIGTAYTWQVRYEDSYGDWSAYSAATKFTTLPGATISGTVFKDSNDNGRMDSGEAGIAGVTVYLDANNDSKLDNGELSTVTSANGTYTFTNVPAGAYIIRQVLPSGYAQTTPADGYGIHISASLNQTLSGNIIGDIAAATVSGIVFNDANGNGVLNSGESGIGGVTVYLDANNDSLLDDGELSTVTAANGAYSFTDVPAGAYIIRQIRPAGEVQTTPADNYGIHIAVSAGQTLTGNNIGDRAGGTISGIVFNDANGNQKMDDGEVGLSGWTLYIDLNNTGSNASGDPTTTTNSSGDYTFTGLALGTYIIRVMRPTGWLQTTPTDNYGQHITIGSVLTVTGVAFGEEAVAQPV